MMAQPAGLFENLDAHHPLVIELGAPDSYWRDNLGEYIEQHLDRQLSRLGAEPPRRDAARSFDEALEDLLCRVDGLGHDGVTLRFSDLSGIAKRGVLTLSDSEVLRRWLELEPLVPLTLDLPDSAWALRAYPAPVPLAELAQRTPGAAPSGNPTVERTPTPSDLAPDSGTHLVPSRTAAADPDSKPDRSNTAPTEGSDDGSYDHDENAAEVEADDVLPLPFAFDDEEFEQLIQAARRPRPSRPALATDTDADPELVSVAELPDGLGEGEENEPSEDVAEVAARAAAREEKAHIRRWRETLEEANGSQSWEDLERLFLASYLPLCHAAADGQADDRAHAALSDWARGFEECYKGAFARLRQGGHRPTMICDLPQLAFAAAREHGAAHTRLVLVDGMRFDLGQRVHDKLRMQLTRFAHCVARGVSWAALPATTAAQLELLARGPTALRNLAGDLDERQWVAGPSTARRLRPLRVGGHNLVKLDVVEAEFKGQAWHGEQLGRAAAEVAVSVGRYIKQQDPGTMVVVFGDHGSPNTADSARGTRPEEVLVPYDMWYVGELD